MLSFGVFAVRFGSGFAAALRSVRRVSTPIFIALTVSGLAALGQSNEWTWMGGSQGPVDVSYGVQGLPVYGVQGTPSPANTPGFRSQAATWVDQKGITWVFSGARYIWDPTGTDSGMGLWVTNEGTPNDLWQFNPVTNEWVWVAGGYTATQQGLCAKCPPPAVYGTLGSPAPGNTPGGRFGSATWTDPQGNFWLFGGTGDEGLLNDLWKFDPVSMEWAWMGGSQTGVGYVSPSGIYGTRGQFASGNVPGSRFGTVSWSDPTGKLWLFGGSGLDAYGRSVELNDLWEYDPVKGQWAWIAGSSFAPIVTGSDTGIAGVYGTLGVPDPANTPGGRGGAVGWTDQSGNLWLFGGVGCDGSSIGGSCAGDNLNDLWKFDAKAQAWAWMGGPSIVPCPFLCGQAGQYGALGVEASSNIPGGRSSATAWTDTSGNVWLFGGEGMDASQQFGNLNDLWMFDTTNLQWKWMGGYSSTSSTCYSGPPGITVPTYCGAVNSSYGTMGVPDPGNYPGGRAGTLGWTEPDGSLWLYSGLVSNEFNIEPNLSDLWRFIPLDSDLPPAVTPLLSAPSGTYTSGSLSITNDMANASIYYTTDGTTPSAKSNLYTEQIPITNSVTISAIAIAPGYSNSGIASATYVIVPPASPPSFSIPTGTYTAIQTLTLSDSTPGASIYYTTDGAAPIPVWQAYTAPIQVSATETISAIAVASDYGQSATASATYTINLPSTFTLEATPASLTLQSGGSGTATLTITSQNGFNSAVSFACSGLPSGASCSFNPATVTPSTGAASTTLTITAPAKSADLRPILRPFLPVTTLALLIGFFGLGRQRKLSLWLLALAAAGALGLLSACGGSSGNGASGGGATTPVTSSVTVTATSGSIQQTATISLTVN